MVGPPPSCPSRRCVVAGAALMTVAVAVGADVAAEGTRLHTLALGLVAAVVAVMRVGLAGRHSGVFATVSGAVVAQPALHAAAKLLHPATDDDSPAHAAQTDALITVIHVLVAAAVIAVIIGCERILLLVASTVRQVWRWLRLLLTATPPAYPTAPVCTVEMRPLPPTRAWVDYLARRGPPRAPLAPA